MKTAFQISAHDWHTFLLSLSKNNTIYVPVKTHESIDYKIFSENVTDIVYNVAKPVTPLKTFFIPIKENLVIEKKDYKKNVMIGVPACDLKALDILDEIYLDPSFVDLRYRENREKYILIGSDCHEIADNCHCTSYGVEPYPGKNADASVISLNGSLILIIYSQKGEEFLGPAMRDYSVKMIHEGELKAIEMKRNQTKLRLAEKNKSLPDYAATGKLIEKSGEDIWIRYSKTCVSCGSCATSCPTCTCFLLIDRPDFEKVRQVDACQYPGFERIAAGEDPLGKKFVRFRNRYLCKYVWKPEKFRSIACTGCGRCIDGCIGNISKNKLFVELASSNA